MPNGIYFVPTPLPRRRGTRSRSVTSRPGAGLRLRTRWRRDRLDEQLANGADPGTSAELTLRAEQIGSGAERVRLAEYIERVLRVADEPAGMSGLLLRRGQVHACADELLALARRLRDDQPIEFRGAAMSAVLLSNGSGPLYYDRGSVRLRQAVRSARLALDEGGQSAQPDVSTAA